MSLLIQGQTVSGSITLLNSLTGNYLVKKIWYLNNLYNVNSYNNKFYFYEATDLTAEIPSGFYLLSELATELETQLNANGAFTYTVSANSITGMFTISANNPFQIRFGTYSESSARLLFGFNAENSAVSASLDSDFAGVLQSVREVYFVLQGTATDDSLLDNNSRVITTAITNSSDYGENVVENVSNSQLLSFINRKTLEYAFYDQDFNLLDIEPFMWGAILELQ